MKQLKYSFIAKVSAVFLYAFCVIGMCYSGATIIGAYSLGFYDFGRTTSFFNAMAELGYSTASKYATLAESVYNMRYWAIVLLTLCAIVLIITFIFLLCSAGHKKGEDDIHLSFFDKIPLDLILAAAFIICAVVCFGVIDELEYSFYSLVAYYSYYDIQEFVLLAVVISASILLVMLTALCFLITFAARVKAGKWWQNTIIYFILRIIFKWLKAIVQEICELIRAVPLVWKTVAITITALILMGILCFNGLYHDELMVAYICACFILLAAIVYAASQLNKLKIAGEKLSSGDFDYKTDTSRMHFDFKRHAENLNSIGDGMARAVEQRIRSERLKTELITNVSHDIKTPLTNIVNYVDLLRRSPTPEEQEQYLEVLSRQAERLKKLTVDLVEASKASTGNIAVELVPTNAEEIINQAVAEYSEKFAAGKLEPIITLPPEPVTILADGRHLWRVLDNLFNNAVKYAQPGTRLYVDVVSSGGEAVISVKNISRERLNVSSDELMERFVRGDSSRHTEGSGLGLSIARSLTELMGGSFNISIDGDLFKAMICLKKAGE